MTRIKICGITNLDDAMLAVEWGADAIGFVFAHSLRRITPAVARKISRAMPPFIEKVGVFVDEDRSTVKELFGYCLLTAVQLHGSEAQEYLDSLALPVIKAFRVKDDSVLQEIQTYNLPHFLLDAYDDNLAGGSGKTFNWAIAKEATRLGRVILSGGLNETNVREALDAVQPYAVDVSSGVESSPGRKEPDKLRKFIREVRSWDREAK